MSVGNECRKESVLNAGRIRRNLSKKQKGGDFTSSLSARTARTKLPWAKFPGELHLPGHSFTGPGTRLDMRLNSDSTPKSVVETHQSHRPRGLPT